jgi:hypothetical protein
MSEDEYREFQKRRGITTVDEKPKKSKYNSHHVWLDGIYFDSQKEADFYSNLKLSMSAGIITGFCLQPKFVLVEGNEKERAITYSADFIIFYKDGTCRVVDTKGYEPAHWERTYKMFRLKYPNLELTVVKD